MARVSLISPNSPGSYRSARVAAENLGIAGLSAFLEQVGHELQILDARLSRSTPDVVARAVAGFQPCVVGISLAWEGAVPWTNEFLRDLHEVDHPVCVGGGYFASLQPARALEMMPCLDAVGVGEGEHVLEESIRRCERGRDEVRFTPGLVSRDGSGGICTTRRPPLISDLDALPWPKRYAASRMGEEFEVLVEASRGCPSVCTFCAIPPFFRAARKDAWRCRSPENLVAEIHAIRAVTPRQRKFRFVDPEFFGWGTRDGERVETLAELLARGLSGIEFAIEARAESIVRHAHLLSKLRDAGLREVYIGLESGSQEILKKLRKHTTVEENLEAVRLLRERRISVDYGFLMFTPWITDHSLRENVEMLKKMGVVSLDRLFHEMELIPGTPALEIVRRERRVTRKLGTGYFTYDLGGLAGRVRLCGRALETRHPQFMEKMWLLFKGAQAAVSAGDAKGDAFEKEVTNLTLRVFDFCVDRLERAVDLNECGVKRIAEACVVAFDSEAESLGCESARDGALSH